MKISNIYNYGYISIFTLGIYQKNIGGYFFLQILMKQKLFKIHRNA